MFNHLELADFAKQRLAIVRELDPSAKIEWSEHTSKFYVSTRLELAFDGMLYGASGPHALTPIAAVDQMFEVLTRRKPTVVVSENAQRRRFVWNGGLAGYGGNFEEV